MKVLIISHLYPSVMNPSYGVFVHEQVKELKKQGCEVTVISPVKYSPFPLNLINRKWRDLSDIPMIEEIDGITVYHPRYPSLPKNILFEQTGQFMYACIHKLVTKLHLQEKFDLIHAHVALPDGYAAYKLSELLRCPYVLTIHGQDFQKTIYYNDMCKKRIETALLHAKKVILVSTKLENLLNKASFRGKIDYTIIPNGVDLEKIDNSNRKANFKTKGPKLLSVSNLYKEKAIDINLKAVNLLREKHSKLEYIIVGDGPERDNLENLAKDLGLKDHVRFLGAFNHENVLEIMKECDVFSMPSTNEAFGVVYIEAMAQGKPVIGCKGEGPQDIIKDRENGFLIDKNDVEQLSSIIDFLFSNNSLRNEIGEKGIKTVEEKFRWNVVAEKLIKEYKKFI